MRVQQLEQFYKDGLYRLKEQMKKQEKERLDQTRRQTREEQRALYEKKLQDAKEARNRELRLVQEELDRITEQAVSLKKQIEGMLDERKE